MKALIILLTIILMPVLSVAENPDSQPIVTFGVGGQFATSNDHIDGGAGLAAHVDYITPNIIGARVFVAYYKADNETGMMLLGENTIVMIGGSLTLSYKSSGITPYVGLGPSLILLDHKTDPLFLAQGSYLGIDVDEKLKDTFGFHIHGGVTIDVTPIIGLNFDIRYLFMKPKYEGFIINEWTGDWLRLKRDLNMETTQLYVGLTFNIGESINK